MNTENNAPKADTTTFFVNGSSLGDGERITSLDEVARATGELLTAGGFQTRVPLILRGGGGRTGNGQLRTSKDGTEQLRISQVTLGLTTCADVPVWSSTIPADFDADGEGALIQAIMSTCFATVRGSLSVGIKRLQKVMAGEGQLSVTNTPSKKYLACLTAAHLVPTINFEGANNGGIVACELTEEGRAFYAPFLAKVSATSYHSSPQTSEQKVTVRPESFDLRLKLDEVTLDIIKSLVDAPDGAKKSEVAASLVEMLVEMQGAGVSAPALLKAV